MNTLKLLASFPGQHALCTTSGSTSGSHYNGVWYGLSSINWILRAGWSSNNGHSFEQDWTNMKQTRTPFHSVLEVRSIDELPRPTHLSAESRLWSCDPYSCSWHSSALPDSRVKEYNSHWEPLLYRHLLSNSTTVGANTTTYSNLYLRSVAHFPIQRYWPNISHLD